MKDRHLCKARPLGTRKQWVTGFYAVLGEKTVIIEKEPEKYHDIEAGKSSCGNKIVEVMPETVCQCTGIKDKNGKLIYENDIMVAYYDEENPEYGTYAMVAWREYGWVTVENNSDDPCPLDDFIIKHFEMVGNIFDNPELLEV